MVIGESLFDIRYSKEHKMYHSNNEYRITIHESPITISGSIMISDFTEFATRLYFCAAAERLCGYALRWFGDLLRRRQCGSWA